MGRFLRAVENEIRSAAPERRGRCDTVFIGGGTPSLMEPEQLSGVMDALHGTFEISPEAESTIEVNPGTVSAGKLAAYRAGGMTRVSIGVQSFDDAELGFLGRIHTAAEAAECIILAREAGFEDVSVDLIYALPGQTNAAWLRTLDRVARYSPDHISAYALIVEEATPLGRRVRAGETEPAAPEREAELYELTMQWMNDHGYEHYEVSNYARPGHRSRHNSAYWDHRPYLGFGPSAHSFWRAAGSEGGRRWWNTSDVWEYCGALESGRSPVSGEETVGVRELINERLFLGLRQGVIDLVSIEREFGVSLPAAITQLFEALLQDGRMAREGDRFRLTPAGFLVCDEIAARLML